MDRRPVGTIDPNSVREAEAHTDSRRRQSRGEPESLCSPQVDRERAAARRRDTARRARETDGARAKRCVRDCRLPNSTAPFLFLPQKTQNKSYTLRCATKSDTLSAQHTRHTRRPAHTAQYSGHRHTHTLAHTLRLRANREKEAVRRQHQTPQQRLAYREREAARRQQQRQQQQQQSPPQG